ncbi:MAG TPA: MEDS domain-containing protein, partial [Acidimicrobiales bacterium]|nr:MEDS domain-containing protein [Acidimicrobiales bacterium]
MSDTTHCESLHHEAFVYSSDGQYVDSLAPLVGDALDAGREVFSVVSPRNAGLLHDALGSRAPSVTWVDATDWYRKPVRTISGYDAILRSLPSGASAFVIGEVQFGSDERAWTEWTRYEWLLNDILRRYPARVVCPYDTRELPRAVVADAARTHPRVLEHRSARPSALYDDGTGTWSKDFAVEAHLPERAADVDLGDELTPLTARRALQVVAGRAVSEARIGEMRLGIS